MNNETRRAQTRSPSLALTKPKQVAELIGSLHVGGWTWCLPVFRAALARRVNVVQVLPGAALSRQELRSAKAGKPRPHVVIVGGDPGSPLGETPDAFPRVAKLIEAAGWLLVHGSGGEPEHYVRAVEAAEAHRLALVIECAAATVPAWLALVAKHATTRHRFAVLPWPGDSHPRPPAALGPIH